MREPSKVRAWMASNDRRGELTAPRSN